MNGKSPTFDTYALRRLVLSELTYKGAFRNNRILGFSRQQIINIIQYPERYGNQIIRLSRFMMQKSGYYKRFIDYFTNSAVINWVIDNEIKQEKMFSINPKTFRKNYINYTAQVNKFKLDTRVSDIFKRLFLEDACFGFITENDIDASLFILEPEYCKIEKIVNGCIFQFSVNRSLIDKNVYSTLPEELQIIIEQSKETSLNNRVMIPYENSFCVKYNNDFTYLYPPFFFLLNEILNIEDVKDLAKAKSEADAYKLIYFKIPTNDDDQISMGDEIIYPFVKMAQEILPDRFGVIPSPMELQLIESKSTVNDDTNKIQEAVGNFYSEGGVSESIISSASSGSELKLSMKVDSSDIYRIYRQIEAWVDLQMKLRGYIYNEYQFVYRILPTTIFDVDDFIDMRLKLAQVSFPVKDDVLAASGINTAKLIGNSFKEQVFKKDIYDKWEVLKTSYTQSGEDSEGGAPQQNIEDLSPSGEQTREGDQNNPDNRI